MDVGNYECKKKTKQKNQNPLFSAGGNLLRYFFFLEINKSYTFGLSLQIDILIAKVINNHGMVEVGGPERYFWRSTNPTSQLTAGPTGARRTTSIQVLNTSKGGN